MRFYVTQSTGPDAFGIIAETVGLPFEGPYTLPLGGRPSYAEEWAHPGTSWEPLFATQLAQTEARAEGIRLIWTREELLADEIGARELAAWERGDDSAILDASALEEMEDHFSDLVMLAAHGDEAAAALLAADSNAEKVATFLLVHEPQRR